MDQKFSNKNFFGKILVLQIFCELVKVTYPFNERKSRREMPANAAASNSKQRSSMVNSRKFWAFLKAKFSQIIYQINIYLNVNECILSKAFSEIFMESECSLPIAENEDLYNSRRFLFPRIIKVLKIKYLRFIFSIFT